MPDFNELMSMPPAERAAFDAELEARRAQAPGGAPATRQAAQEVVKRAAVARFPDEREEVAIGKLLRTDVGKRMRHAAETLPSAPVAAPVEAYTPLSKRQAPTTSAGAELATEAKRIAKGEGVSFEVALGKAAKRDPELAYRHSQEESALYPARSRNNS